MIGAGWVHPRATDRGAALAPELVARRESACRTERGHPRPCDGDTRDRRLGDAVNQRAVASRPSLFDVEFHDVGLSVGRGTLALVPDGPLIVQSDKTLLLEVDHPDALACRMAIAPFAELERSPEHVHTYRLTPLGLWNARAAGHDAEGVVDALIRFSRYPVPHALLVDIAETMDRYGRLQLVNHPEAGLVLHGLDRMVLIEVAKSKKLAGMLGGRVDEDTLAVHPSERGRLKQALLKLGWPAEDLAGYVDGEAHAIALAED